MPELASTFIGIDLAWSARNGSGAVTLRADGDRQLAPDGSVVLYSDEEILGYLEERALDATGPFVAAIDALLIAPNAPGTGRPADREVTRLYGRFHAGAYPANRERCARPVSLARALAARGWSLDPWEAGWRPAASPPSPASATPSRSTPTPR